MCEGTCGNGKIPHAGAMCMSTHVCMPHPTQIATSKRYKRCKSPVRPHSFCQNFVRCFDSLVHVPIPLQSTILYLILLLMLLSGSGGTSNPDSTYASVYAYMYASMLHLHAARRPPPPMSTTSSAAPSLLEYTPGWVHPSALQRAWQTSRHAPVMVQYQGLSSHEQLCEHSHHGNPHPNRSWHRQAVHSARGVQPLSEGCELQHGPARHAAGGLGRCPSLPLHGSVLTQISHPRPQHAHGGMSRARHPNGRCRKSRSRPFIGFHRIRHFGDAGFSTCSA